MPELDDLKTNLALLSQEFLTGLAEQWGAIETNWVCCRRNAQDSAASHALMQQLHSLTGSAASLGFEQIAASARTLQDILRSDGSYGDQQSIDGLFASAEAGMQTLRAAVYTDRQIDLTELTQRLGMSKASSTSLQEKRSARLIFLVEDDHLQADELAEQVGYFGYSVQIFHEPADLESALRKTVPAAVLMMRFLVLTFPM